LNCHLKGKPKCQKNKRQKKGKVVKFYENFYCRAAATFVRSSPQQQAQFVVSHNKTKGTNSKLIFSNWERTNSSCAWKLQIKTFMITTNHLRTA